MGNVREKVRLLNNSLSAQQGKYSRTSKQGSVLMLVLGVFTLLLILFISISSLSLRTYNNTKSDIEHQQAYLYAKSVLQVVVDDLLTEPEIVKELVKTNYSTTAKMQESENVIDVELYFDGNGSDNITVTASSNYGSASASISAVIMYDVYEDATVEISYRFLD